MDATTMREPKVGDVWRRYRIDGQDVVTVFYVESMFVVVEFRDKKYAYGGQHREWWPRAWFSDNLQFVCKERGV